MKNFVKLIPVALGLLTLASCSNDDLFGDSAKSQQQLNSGDLIVSTEALTEDGSAFTRSYLSQDLQTRMFVTSDELRVYDNDLHKYDIYAFNWKDDANQTGVFRRKTTSSNITSAQWALYPKEDVISGTWNYNEETNKSTTDVTMRIRPTMTYDATFEKNDTETPLYKDVLPRWGQVTAVNDGAQLETSLSYMTGVLRVQLAGIPDYAQFLKIQMFAGGVEDSPIGMNGEFETTIALDEVKQPNASLKGEVVVKEQGDDYIIVELPTPQDIAKVDPVEAKKAVVYVPLVTTTTQVNIVVSTNAKELADLDEAEDKVYDASYWKKQAEFKNKVITKGKLYGNSKEINLALDGTDPNAISDALELIEAEDGKIILKATNGINICEEENTILIPDKGEAAITIDLTAGLDNDCTGESGTLYIKYANAAAKHKGSVTLLVPGTATTKDLNLDVDLDETPFGIAGIDGVKPFKKLDIDATDFVVGDGATTTNATYGLLALSDNVTTLTVAKSATLGKIVIDDATAKNVATVTVNGTVTNAIDATNKVVNVTIDGNDAVVGTDIVTKGTVTINSKQTFNATKVIADGNITIGSEAKFTDALTELTSKEGTIALSGKAYFTNNPVKAKGNITISEEAQVVNGTITSEEGSISIGNSKAKGFSGAITAKENVTISGKSTITGGILAGGNVSLSDDAQVTTKAIGAVDKEINNLSISGNAYTSENIYLKGAANVNISKNGGDAVAIAGTLYYKNGTAYALNLTQGYVNGVNASNGEVALTFSTDPAFAAIKTVTTPANLVPQNESIWNGEQMNATDGSNYRVDNTDGSNDLIWTASQLAWQLKAASGNPVVLQSNIDLNNETWGGIEPTEAYTIVGNYKTISNVKAKGNKDSKTAGFINKTQSGKKLTISNLTFDGVQTEITTISGGQYDGGIGAVVGQAIGQVDFSRVIVELAGTNFGAQTTKNVLTANVGGLIGQAADVVTLTGVSVDASATTLTAYKNIGGFIGYAASNVYIKMAEEDGADPEVFPAVTGLKMFVTFNATEGSSEVNDPYQGTTGQFIGAINLENKTIKIADVADIKPTLTITGKVDETKAFKIEDETHRYFFGRGDQTLIGQSGFKWTGTVTKPEINGKVYEVFKTGVPFTVGSPKLYELTNEPHVN